jgi:hypothetical protein
LALFQVTRRKGETNRSRYRRNGYVHQQQSHRQSVRHREQARLLQFDPGASGKYSSAVMALSRAGSLLQFDPGASGRYGLAVRPSSRASSAPTASGAFVGSGWQTGRDHLHVGRSLKRKNGTRRCRFCFLPITAQAINPPAQPAEPVSAMVVGKRRGRTQPLRWPAASRRLRVVPSAVVHRDDAGSVRSGTK